MSDALVVSNLVISKYGTFRHEFEWSKNGVPVDFTGKTAKMQIRSTYDSTVIHELTSVAGITLTSGLISLFISASVTATFSLVQNAVYDLFIYDNVGENEKFAKGRVEVLPSVTHG